MEQLLLSQPSHPGVDQKGVQSGVLPGPDHGDGVLQPVHQAALGQIHGHGEQLSFVGEQAGNVAL